MTPPIPWTRLVALSLLMGTTSAAACYWRYGTTEDAVQGFVGMVTFYLWTLDWK